MKQHTPRTKLLVLSLFSASLLALQPQAGAYQRYSACASCHGAFTDATSPKGTKFPSNDKHAMHRSSSYMGTTCALCHRSDDGRNPYIKSSDGVAGVLAGVGCTGCHEPIGLRAHHERNGVPECSECHNDPAPPREGTRPLYYGTAYTKANNPENPVMLSNTNENWSVGDFLGLDNDGDNLYDMADYDCGPYRLTSVAREGDNIRISWQTAGGRSEIVQASASLNGAFTNASPVITIPGVGVLTTNYLELGSAPNSPLRFYRVKSAP